MIKAEDLIIYMERLVVESPLNFVSAEEALDESCAGMKLWESPLVGFADAEDVLFAELRRKEAVGPQFMLPQEWLPGARTVISFFLPFSERVKKSNYRQNAVPSNEWLHGRYEGHRFVTEMMREVKGFLEANSYKAVAPTLEEAFASVEMPNPAATAEWQGASFTSNWSERHVAYISGLGTFGLSKGLITKKGIAGRFGSIVTDAAFPVTTREYSGIYDYCIMCGLCAARCPVQAIDLGRGMNAGKDHFLCGPFVAETKAKYAPRYGCGKCQTNVPCESRIPK